MALLHLGSEYPRQDSHLRREFRKLAFFLLNYGDGKSGAPCRCCPGARGLEDRRACCYTNGAEEMVAAAGIAPASPPLQGGANLSQLNSQNGPSTR